MVAVKTKTNRHIGNIWQMQEAKARLSEVVKKAQFEPQIITLHGEQKAKVTSMAYDEGNDHREKEMSAYDFWRNSPLYGVELELPPRIPEPLRELDL
jgi:prevent-host-death family protein